MESSVQVSKRQRETRIERLRKDDKLRTAYYDLVIAPPHIFHDDEFWSTYAWDPTQNVDDFEASESGNGEQLSSEPSLSSPQAVPSATSVSSPSKSSPMRVLPVFVQDQSKSIETELSAGKGFLELLSSNFVDGRLRLVLTPALRKQIYEEFPLVRVAYQSRVPSTMTPPSFWDTFFRAQLVKLMKKKSEAEEEAAAKERERRNKTKSRSKAKKAKETASTSATTTPKSLTKEVDMMFFERLTEATPTQLNSLVWKSRASDAITQDPSKSSSRSNLMPMLAEDDIIPTSSDATTTAIANSLSSTAISSSSSLDLPPDHDASSISISNTKEAEQGQSTSSQTQTKIATSSSSSSSSNAPTDPISKQQQLLSQRIAQLSRGGGVTAAAGEKRTSLAPSPGTTTGTITAEEMLFSALQEQTQVETSGTGSRGKVHSAGTQSVLNAWYGGGGTASESQSAKYGKGGAKLNDAIEVLDGIVVEAGELDDASWSELKREKERRNRHLQLIRKFNRHGHIVVSSTSHLEANEMEETRNTLQAGTVPPTLPIPPPPEHTHGYQQNRVKTEFGGDTTTTDDTHGRRDESKNVIRVSTSSSMDVDEIVVATGSEMAPKDSFAHMHDKQITSFRYPRIPPFQPPILPPEPSPSSILQVMSDLSSWSKSPITRPKRPTQQLTVKRPSSSTSEMEIDLSNMEQMLDQVDQWKRHFWNLMERACASQTLSKQEGDPFSFLGAEKLPPIITKLQEFLEIMKEMREFLTQSNGHLERHQKMALNIARQEDSVSKCFTVYQQIQP